MIEIVSSIVSAVTFNGAPTEPLLDNFVFSCLRSKQTTKNDRKTTITASSSLSLSMWLNCISFSLLFLSLLSFTSKQILFDVDNSKTNVTQPLVLPLTALIGWLLLLMATFTTKYVLYSQPLLRTWHVSSNAAMFWVPLWSSNSCHYGMEHFGVRHSSNVPWPKQSRENHLNYVLPWILLSCLTACSERIR